MIRLFIDANILLDAVLQRPHDPQDALNLLALGEQRKVILVTTSNSLGVVLYTLQRSDKAKKGALLQAARNTLRDLLACVEVAPMEAAHLHQSAASSFGDIEDGAQYFAASASGALDGVVSRDPDFDGRISGKRYSAAQALRLIAAK